MHTARLLIVVSTISCFVLTTLLHGQQEISWDFNQPQSSANIRVTDPEAWQRTEDGTLAQTTASNYKPPHRSPVNLALLPAWAGGDFVLTADLMQTGPEYAHRDMCIVFAFQAPDRYLYAHLSTEADETAHHVQLVDQADRTPQTTYRSQGVHWGQQQWRRIELACSDQSKDCTVSVDGEIVLQANNLPWTDGFVGFGTFDDQGAIQRVVLTGDQLRHQTATVWQSLEAENSTNQDKPPSGPTADGTVQGKWTPLFNGKNLDGWTMKMNGHELGANPLDTVVVEDGAIKMRYDDYDQFGDRFGHLFYKEPFENYRLRLQYRFTGDQVDGAPGWAWRNSGVMLHCQDPATMRKDQPFPICLEFQFLGGDGTNDRSTGNLCTPGTNVTFDNKQSKAHIIESKGKTFHGDQWVNMEVEVLGSQRIRHYIDGELVLEYERPQLDPSDADAKRIIDAAHGEPAVGSGWISLQAESHPIEFRAIELMRLNSDGTPATSASGQGDEQKPTSGQEQ